MTINPQIIPKSRSASNFSFYHPFPNKNKIENKIAKAMKTKSQGWTYVFTFSGPCSSLTEWPECGAVRKLKGSFF